ncbi:MAG: hypothetical protein HY293_18590 [Planctomycetes bacterium]|nr:hypothetical protein [Planctomycetota bacterium]
MKGLGGKAGLAVLSAGILAAGAALWLRSRHDPVGEGPRPEPRAHPPQTSSEPAGASFQASPAGSLAHRLSLILPRIAALREPRKRNSLTREEEDSLTVLEGDAALLTGELRTLLKGDPQAWRDLLDLLSTLESPETARMIADRVNADMDSGSEILAADLLKSGQYSGARRLGAAMLMHRDSPGSRSSLMSAAQDDPDPGVRHAALLALAQRPERDKSLEEAAVIVDFFRSRGQTEPNEELRNIARRLAGEAVPGDSALAAPPARPKVAVSPVKPVKPLEPAKPAGPAEAPK